MFKRLKTAAIIPAVVLPAWPVSALGAARVERVALPAEAPGLDFSCAYPRVFGIGSETNRQKLNLRLRERAQCAQQSARLAAASAPVHGSFDFSVARNSGGILSIVTTNTLTQNGAVRTEKHGVTVSTGNGTLYTLDALFLPGADYIGVLSERVRTQIAAQKLAGKQRKPFTQIERYPEFYLTDRQLVLLVPQSTFFAAECGVLEFRISLQSLDGELRPAFRA